MNMALYTSRDFTGTGLDSAFDKMRANAMINAQHDTRGLSVLLFNINAFLSQGRKKEIFHILNLWAIEPIKRNRAKFEKHPKEGHNALQNRIKTLENSLSGQPGIGYWFTRDAAADMGKAIDKEMHAPCPEIFEQEKIRA